MVMFHVMWLWEKGFPHNVIDCSTLSSIVSISHVQHYRYNEYSHHVSLARADYPIYRLLYTRHQDHTSIPHMRCIYRACATPLATAISHTMCKFHFVEVYPRTRQGHAYMWHARSLKGVQRVSSIAIAIDRQTRRPYCNQLAFISRV